MRSGPFYHVRFANWNKLCFCITWQNTKIAFSLKWCISVLPEFNQVLDVFSLFDSRLILTLLYDFQNIAINSFSSGLLGAWLMRKEVESVAEVGLCCIIANARIENRNMSQLSIQSHTLIALAGTHKDTVNHSLCVQSKGNRHRYIVINT